MAALLALQSVVLSFLTQYQALDDVLIVILIWFGAFMVQSEALPWRPPRPSRFSLWLGFTLVLSVLWRSDRIVSMEAVSSLLPLIAGLGLALLAAPVRRLKAFLPALTILALLPVIRVLLVLIPQRELSFLNAQIVKVILLLAALPVQIEGTTLSIPGGAIEILQECNASTTLFQLILVAIVFAMAFPMRFLWQNIVMILVAPLFGILVNACRIAILALINASDAANQAWWFEQVHTGWLSLVFPAIAMLLFVQVYLIWMEHQVSSLERE
ncbi:MAG: archaeosortase/exosortase family protein [Cyanobacteriota bacterium]|nr:archaeosortase/exosortase family protein [Cyanobacteriota bacterium]